MKTYLIITKLSKSAKDTILDSIVFIDENDDNNETTYKFDEIEKNSTGRFKYQNDFKFQNEQELKQTLYLKIKVCDHCLPWDDSDVIKEVPIQFFSSYNDAITNLNGESKDYGIIKFETKNNHIWYAEAYYCIKNAELEIRKFDKDYLINMTDFSNSHFYGKSNGFKVLFEKKFTFQNRRNENDLEDNEILFPNETEDDRKCKWKKLESELIQHINQKKLESKKIKKEFDQKALAKEIDLRRELSSKTREELIELTCKLKL